ncbi:capsule assembly Wzi family protein [Marinobacter salicampi]|uniref:capsule assembly Wzi family protein n=1 Tax=Marinobacter salicampi TaxID=435907 RepID=UPI00140DA83F|nr:capsule assembly Wzi family protein [Marinobacter salicampi]
MSSMYWARVGGAVACLVISLQASFAYAAPWLEPGDARARHGIQKLADRGHVNRSVTTWPIMWASIESGLNRYTADADASSVGDGLAYLKFEQSIQAAPGFQAELGVGATSEPGFLRGFKAGPREEGVAELNLQWLGNAWALGLSPTATVDPEDDESFRLDGSYLAATAGNWVFGAGAIDRWWGPGWQSSLILSNNARPVPAVWLNRRDAFKPQSPWLSWIGPWQLTVYAGQLESERAVPDAKLVGMRLTVRPIAGLDVGLSRSLMLGGDGRPENGSTFWNALIGRDNGQEGQANDPGNQLGSIDARYGFGLGEQTMGLYAQMMGEDEAGAFPARKSWLFGADLTSQWFAADQQWFAEYINTIADDLISDPLPNITYEHSIYQRGYRYYGRSLAASLDGDAEAVTLGGFHFFNNGSNLGAALTFARLNTDGATRTAVTDESIFYSVPADNQDVAYLSMNYGSRLLAGWLDLNASVASEKTRLIGGVKAQWALGAEWRYRF